MRWPSRLALAAAAILALALAGCAGIVAVGAERVQISRGLSVAGETGWNRLPPAAFGADQAWTRDGPGLDLVLFVAGRSEGAPLLDHRRPRLALLLHAAISPSEIVELWATELALMGHRQVQVGRLQPTEVAERPGFRFQYAYADADGLQVDGFAAGAVVAGRVYLIAFQGARAHPFAAHWPAFARLLASARIAPG